MMQPPAPAHRAAARLLAVLAMFLTAAAAMSQHWGEGRRNSDTDVCRTARDVPRHSTGTPAWTYRTGFEKDVFTFVRLKWALTSCFTP